MPKTNISLKLHAKLLDNKINQFYNGNAAVCRKPLEAIINKMIAKCRYINGESLERHNWGSEPVKLAHIPTNVTSPNFESDLLNALDLPENEKSIIELLWGDIQLGKRVQACVIMWISIYILHRPVLYIFRNLEIDQSQLKADILGTDKQNFNIEFIKSCFETFNAEITDRLGRNDKYKDFKLTDLKDINEHDILNKLGCKDAMNPTDIFCCLMNITQLSKIDEQFTKYIINHKELVNISLLVDESDLMAPTSSNDKSNDSDIKDTTKCEKMLAKIYKKVKYVLHITGTAHSLLYNVTTRLSHSQEIQLKISKVHKMQRSTDYYGLFNNMITFNTSHVKPWWSLKNEDSQDNDDKPKYDIISDYRINIRGIIKHIIRRNDNYNSYAFNSLLISEEKIRKNQFELANSIMSDFESIFLIVYHGKCLRFYLNEAFRREFDYFAKRHKILHEEGGIYGEPKAASIEGRNYCYYDLDTRKYTIKQLYKLLRVVFVSKRNGLEIPTKTVITITGKYGERGYSFTSDDYDKYSMHLTDQYFVSHATFNCTDISQRLRIQGKYSSPELKTGSMKLTLWTTSELQDVMQNFYIKLIMRIESKIMSCNKWEDIKDILENIFDSGDLNFEKYLKYIDSRKKTKSIATKLMYDRVMKANKVLNYVNMTELEISKYISENNLPSYNCINTIQQMSKPEFLVKNGAKKWNINTIFDLSFAELNVEFKKLGYSKEYKPTVENGKQVCCLASENKQTWDYEDLQKKLKGHGPTSTHGIHNGIKINNDCATRVWVGYNKSGIPIYILKYAKKTQDLELPPSAKNIVDAFNNEKQILYSIEGDFVKYSVINQDVDINNLPRHYYFKTPAGILWYYGPKLTKLSILSPSNTNTSPTQYDTSHVFSETISSSSSSSIIGTPEKVISQNSSNSTDDELKQSLEQFVEHV